MLRPHVTEYDVTMIFFLLVTTGRFQYPYQRKRLRKKKKKKGKEQGQNLAISPKRNPNFQYLADVDFENPAFGSLNS